MIERISLTDFKCFLGKTDFPVSQFNVLYGMNGRGKSTLLQALLLFAQSIKEKNSISKLLLKGSLVNLGTFKDVVNSYSGAMHFGIQIKDKKDSISATYGEDNNPTFAELTELTDGNNTFFSENSTSSSNNDSESKRTAGVIDKSTFPLLDTLEHIKYVSAERLGPREFMERKPIENDALGVQGENSFQIIEAQGVSFAEDIRAYLDEVLGGASLRYQTSNDKSIIQLYLDSVSKTKGFKPINVGFGYSYILPILIAFLLAHEEDVLIIENPEAHLHPAAQSRLAALMLRIANEKKLQLFVETHSDHVVNGLRIGVKNGNIDCRDVNILHFVMRNASSSFEQIKMDAQGNLSSFPEDFMDEWTKQLIQLV